MNKKIINLQQKLKIKFNKKSLLITALTHKSADQKNNNEKLEFLGDRVIGLVLSTKLYELYPDHSEGILDKKFANLVNGKVCCNVAWSIGLQNYIIIGNKTKKITLNDEKILSDSCEALVAAIYLDQGLEKVKDFILNIWKKNIEQSSVLLLDPKTKLQEYSLKKYKKLPNYKVLSSTGPRHNPIFKISVSITNTKTYIGEGRSKQQGELNAASKLLQHIDIN
jgi:ribonuclease-3